MYKIIIPAILAIFILWILLQISPLEMSIVKNPMNYFIVFIIFFLFIKMVKEKQQ
ncbi:hypothetical protein ACT3UT_03710 [Bacillus spizizenii ATCC 6633 = JCM 2499]|uniref:Uncharacterized protein n=1 Tax=Bacillus spizizenii (strain ATCC 23059 / NRRL B-14472 / W23) TaxID=655816 RepID=E0TZ87_BACSH|nr:hypothetical protein [Bacillus spizizenii]QCJ19059.1 hypothetical protein FA024_18850 [Bacillus subtilis]ADM40036.1 hypothetical protein BSUW23_20020 [Bacillus spizizenii str. W23]AJW85462.1 membrane protein [Bacillus spizizenii]EFG93852.1 hypothetical protein BSU6633_02509 [Bacillus spizizenii ATCC 6633 = JCM 2499]MBE0171077.1 hypothetical protein [Bacillus spizizenii]